MDDAVGNAAEAGRAALERAAYAEAVAQFERALGLLEQLPETRERLEQAVDIRLDLRLALLPLEQIDRIVARLGEAERLAARLGDQRRQARIASFAANAYSALGDHERATEAGHRTLAIAEELSDERLTIVAYNQLGAVSWCRGDYRSAIEGYRWNVERIRGELIRDRLGLAGYPAVIARAGLAVCLAELGQFEEAIGFGEEAVQLAETLEHPPTLAHACLFLGGARLRRGDLAAAIPPLERSLALGRAHELPVLFPGTATWLGYAQALTGRVDDGLALLEEAAEQATARGRTGAQSHRDACLGEAYLLVGRPADAERLARRSVELAEGHGERGFRAWALRLFGEISARRDPEAAENWFREALALADELGMRPLHALCRLGLGKLYRRAGRVKEARAELAVAIEMLRTMGMTFWLPEAEGELANLA